jgi:uncharacterized protein YfaQ (DUF2300 family)
VLSGDGLVDCHADCHDSRHEPRAHLAHWSRYAERMTVKDMLTALQALPRDAELLAFEAGCEDYCEREVDEVEWQGGRVYLHLWRPPGRPAARLGGGPAALVLGRPVALAGFNAVAAAVWCPPGAAPDDWLWAVGRAGLAVVGA